MRYGLCDLRNYDSIELTTALIGLEALFEPEPPGAPRTSRRRVTWAGVLRARDRLESAGVAAVVADTPPPHGSGLEAEPVGAVWIARLPAATRPPEWSAPGEIRIDLPAVREHPTPFPLTFDPGWSARVDGRPAAIRPSRDGFLAVDAPPGARELLLRYDPAEVRTGAIVSGIALAALVTLAALRHASSHRETRFGGLDAPAGGR
jgi:hypothetical protein